MTKEETQKALQTKYDTIKMLKGVSGLPDDLHPKEICKECNIGVVWGEKFDGDKEVRYMRSEATGSTIKRCAECNDVLLQKIADSHNLEASRRYRAYVERQKGEVQEKKTNRSRF